LAAARACRGACADQGALLLGQRGKQVKDEWVYVWAQLGDQEGDFVSHQPADEMNVAAEAVQLGHRHVAPELPSRSQGRLELRPTVQRVRAFAGLHLDKLTGNGEVLGFREVLKCLPLGFNAQA